MIDWIRVACPGTAHSLPAQENEYRRSFPATIGSCPIRGIDSPLGKAHRGPQREGILQTLDYPQRFKRDPR
jgi:hypothetical protein